MKPMHLLVMMSSCAGLAASVGQAQFTPLPGWPYSLYANPTHDIYSADFADNEMPSLSRGVAGNPVYWMMRPGHSFDAVRNDRQVVTMVGEIDRSPTGSVTGDRLGYDITGLRDVNGDGFNDWAATWYYATPNGGPGGSARFNPDDGDFGIYGEPFLVECTDGQPLCFGSTGQGKYGFVQVFSGIDNSPIGGKIWGSYPNSRLAHEIASMHDIDGDGADELIMSSNTSGVPGSAAEAGVAMVFSYTNKYNANINDTTRRWVSIYEIYGHRQTVQLGYQLDKIETDYNNDGQQDIVVASEFYDRDGIGRRADNINSPNYSYAQSGASWLFLTPDRQVFTAYQSLPDGQRPAHPQRPTVMAPLTITTEHYAVATFKEELDLATNTWRTAGSSQVAFMGSAGDIDGDGYRDVYVIGPVDPSIVDEYNNDPYRLGSTYPASTSKRGALFYLSGSPLNRTPWASMFETGLTRPAIYLDSNGTIQWPQTVRSQATANWQPPIQTVLHPWDADFVLAPDSAGGDLDTQGSVLAGVNLDDESGTDLCIFEDRGSANESPFYLIPNLPAKYRASVGVDSVNNAPLYSASPVFYSRHDPIGNTPVYHLNVHYSNLTTPPNV